MNKDEPNFTLSELKQIYAACWDVGAPNLSGLAHDLPTIIGKARNEMRMHGGGDYAKHPVVKLMLGHMSYLAGISLGPELEVAKDVEILIAARECKAEAEAALLLTQASREGVEL